MTDRYERRHVEDDMADERVPVDAQTSASWCCAALVQEDVGDQHEHKREDCAVSERTDGGADR